MSAETRRIPVFDLDGNNLGTRTRDTISNLAQSGLVALERNRKGHVVAAHMRGVGGLNPVQSRPGLGTRYSHLENVGTKRAWALSRIGGGRGYAPSELRDRFFSVVDSITTSQTPQTT